MAANYLVWFECLSKFVQDCIFTEWYKFASAGRSEVFLFVSIHQDQYYYVFPPMNTTSGVENDSDHGTTHILGKQVCTLGIS